MADTEQPHQELVKCVVVGDTAVGKTRLICGRACNKRLTLSHLLTTHVPTVWAIDQYRMCQDVLERSWEIVDGVKVSLRLWDTFGDHEKDRRFAYGRSDVILMCFSLTNHMSLRNCKAMWFPEIRQFCPQTPILLVGCKNDLRYMYRDETYLSYFRERSPFLRPVRKCDLVMPDEARALAREFGIFYYETSVLTYYGVNEVFENAIRAALIARRNQRFWMTSLKKVQRPFLQSPYCPPKPTAPAVQIAPSTFSSDTLRMYQQQMHTDVVFVVGETTLTANKFILAAASVTFERLFQAEGVVVTRSNSESSLLSSLLGETTSSDFNEDTNFLLQCEATNKQTDIVQRRSSCQVISYSKGSLNIESNLVYINLHHPAFTSVRTERCSGIGLQIPHVQTVVKVNKCITPIAMAKCLKFLYTGTIDVKPEHFDEVKHAAGLLELEDLITCLCNIEMKNEILNLEIKQEFRKKLQYGLKRVCIYENLYSDIVFQLDDGVVVAHRAMLAARCDVMRAMFSGGFKEDGERIIYLPGVRMDTFYKLATYLYTDTIKTISSTRCLDLIELANRLCLPRFTNLIEKMVVDELSRFSAKENSDVIQPCLRLLETCKLHNADQLANWCMIYLCVNYNKLCKLSPKLLKSLLPENQEYLMEHRWPPVWYLKDSDYYNKRTTEQQKEEKLLFKRGSSTSKCSCFGANDQDKSPEFAESPITVTWKIS